MFVLSLGEPNVDSLEIPVIFEEQFHHVVLVVGVPELGILPQKVQLLLGEQLLGLLFVLDEMEAISLYLHGRCLTFLRRVLR